MVPAEPVPADAVVVVGMAAGVLELVAVFGLVGVTAFGSATGAGAVVAVVAAVPSPWAVLLPGVVVEETSPMSSPPAPAPPAPQPAPPTERPRPSATSALPKLSFVLPIGEATGTLVGADVRRDRSNAFLDADVGCRPLCAPPARL